MRLGTICEQSGFWLLWRGGIVNNWGGPLTIWITLVPNLLVYNALRCSDVRTRKALVDDVKGVLASHRTEQAFNWDAETKRELSGREHRCQVVRPPPVWGRPRGCPQRSPSGFVQIIAELENCFLRCFLKIKYEHRYYPPYIRLWDRILEDEKAGEPRDVSISWGKPVQSGSPQSSHKSLVWSTKGGHGENDDKEPLGRGESQPPLEERKEHRLGADPSSPWGVDLGALAAFKIWSRPPRTAWGPWWTRPATQPPVWSTGTYLSQVYKGGHH